MASLASQSIADSYEQLLCLPDGGGNTTTLVALTDGDAGTTFCLQLSTTKAMIEGSGSKLFFSDEGGEYISGNNTALTLNSGEDINLTCASGDVNIPANIGLTLGNDGEKIEGDGTDLTIASSNLLNLTATTDVIIPVNVGLKFGDGNQHIETDNTDLTITSDVSINLSAPQIDLLVDTNFVTTGGANGMSIDGTTFSVDGSTNRIGIGTASPTTTLHVVGGTNAEIARFAESGGQYLSFHHYDGSGAGIDAGATPADGSWGIYPRGTSYTDLHLGRQGKNVIVGCDDGTAVPDATMPTQSFSFYINGSDLKVRFKDTSGNTYTGTITGTDD